jgi:hypothetical protein
MNTRDVMNCAYALAADTVRDLAGDEPTLPALPEAPPTEPSMGEGGAASAGGLPPSLDGWQRAAASAASWHALVSLDRMRGAV